MFTIHEESFEMLPQERLEKMGERSLSNVELLAVILRTGTKDENVFHLSQRIFDTFTTMYDFKTASLEELQEVTGVGRVKSAQIKAMLELGRRAHIANQKIGERIVSSRQLAKRLIPQLKDYKQEHLIVIYLNTRNAIIREKTIFVGTINSSLAHPREIFREAVRYSASGIILVHNHPSGVITPSKNDRDLTKEIDMASQTIGIPLIDHIIVGVEDYYSFREKGELSR